MIDYWQLSRDYAPGDAVQRFDPVHGDLSPFVGRVTAVLPGIGFVDVQWQFGNERMSADDIVKVNPAFCKYLPPSLDFDYHPGFDVTRQRQASNLVSLWNTQALPSDFHKDLAKLWAKGANEVLAYDELWHKHNARVEDALLRAEVSKFYRFASNCTQTRIDAFVSRTAAYWVAQNRHYRVTQTEIQVKRPSCPKCSTQLRKTTYKMSKGIRARLFACPKCLFLVKRDNLLSPDGLPVEW